jgi:hypothetical protein
MSHVEPDRPEYMNGWRWEDPRWREWTQRDPQRLVLEALRRAVDIRDTNAQQIAVGAQLVMLVDVLDALSESLNLEEPDLWDGTDLWNARRFVEGHDEAAFWDRHHKG